MNNIKVSVIIPVYNVENFLERNLLILTKQNLNEIEFICINDASTDNSLNILKAFKEVFPDKFIIVDLKENGGPGRARNIGISYARGEYIGFVDSDDTAHENMFSDMYSEAISGDYDIVACGYYDKSTNRSISPYEIKGEPDDMHRKYYLLNTFYIWNKIYKRELIMNMSKIFREVGIYEDTDFVIEAGLRAKRVSAIPNIYYHYELNTQSITKKRKISIENECQNIADLLDSIITRAKTTDKLNVAQSIVDILGISLIKNMLELLFIKPDFCLKDFIKFDLFAKKYCPEYFKTKHENTKVLKELIYNQLADNPETSYKNLIKFRESIENGEFDKNMNKKGGA